MRPEFRLQFFKVVVPAMLRHVSSHLFEFIPLSAEDAEGSQTGPGSAEEGQAAQIRDDLQRR